MVLEKEFKKSKINFEVEKRQLEYKGKPINQWGTFRTDNNEYLAPVGKDYTIIQNKELFNLPSLLVESGVNLGFKEAYAMDNGRRVYASFKLPDPIVIGKTDDIIESRMSVTTMHGGGGLFAFLELIRLVCSNGMTRAEKSKMISIRHLSGAPFQLEEAQNTLLGITGESKKFGELLNKLATVQMKTEQIKRVIESLFRDKKGDIYSSTTRQNRAREILTNFDVNDGDMFPSQRGTAFNLYNAITRYTDHSMRFKVDDGGDKNSVIKKGILFGAGAAFKFAALIEITKIVGIKYV